MQSEISAEVSAGTNEKSEPGVKNSIYLGLAFLIGGFAVTFTQEFHESVIVNRAILAVFFVLFAVALPLSLPFFVRERRSEILTFGVWLLSVASVVLSVSALFSSIAVQLTLILLIWATITAVYFILTWVKTRTKSSRALAVIIAVLALALIFTQNSLVMSMGLFTAAGILTGVYLLIAAFDPTKTPTSKV